MCVLGRNLWNCRTLPIDLPEYRKSNGRVLVSTPSFHGALKTLLLKQVLSSPPWSRQPRWAWAQQFLRSRRDDGDVRGPSRGAAQMKLRPSSPGCPRSRTGMSPPLLLCSPGPAWGPSWEPALHQPGSGCPATRSPPCPCQGVSAPLWLKPDFITAQLPPRGCSWLFISCCKQRHSSRGFSGKRPFAALHCFSALPRFIPQPWTAQELQVNAWDAFVE